MTTRVRHNLELPIIARAIQEYKTTHKTQRECAAEYGISYKLFSYYYLNGFKKNQKVGGELIPEETAYQKKAKQRANNYNIVLLGGNTDNNKHQLPMPPQLSPAPVSHQYPVLPNKSSSKDKATISVKSNTKAIVKPQQNNSIKDQMKAATKITKDGKKHLNLDGFI